jgi:hypothetical protein
VMWACCSQETITRSDQKRSVGIQTRQRSFCSDVGLLFPRDNHSFRSKEISRHEGS